MDSFKQYLLLEKTFALGQDVDMIYNKFFKTFIKKIRSNKWGGYKWNEPANKSKTIHSADLKSRDAKAAHDLNPIRIVRGIDNSYTPSKSIIHLSIPQAALEFISGEKGFSNAISTTKLNPSLPRLNDDVSEAKMKASIYHELAHWVDDSLHNFYITRTVQKASHDSDRAREIMNQGHSSVNQTSFEINAQIHSLKQRKRSLSQSEWDNLKFDDIMANFEPFNSMRKEFIKNPKEYTNWRKAILKRMVREKLLGKKMKIRRKFR